MAQVGCDKMMHRMTFYQSTTLQLWFDGWATSSIGGYAAALVGLAALGAANEAVAALRSTAAARAAGRKCCGCGTTGNGAGATGAGHGAAEPLLAPPPRPCCAAAVAAVPLSTKAWRAAASPAGAAATYAVHAIISYLLMLAVMSFNVGAALSVVAGLALGHAAVRTGGGLADACCAPADVAAPLLP